MITYQNEVTDRKYMKITVLISHAVILAFSIIIAASGCAQPAQPSSPQPPVPDNQSPDLYTNAQYGFTFKVCDDSDFELKENQGGAAVALLGPFLRDIKHRIGIYVILDKLPPKTTLEGYLKMQQTSAGAKLTNFAIVDETDITIAGIPGKLSQSTFTVVTDDGEINFKTALAVFIKNDTVYAIQYQNDAGLYDENVDCFNTVLSTFRFN